MKIGEKVRIKESLAGVGFDYSEGQVIELNEQNIEHLEGLLRGGSAEAVTFPDSPASNRGENEGTDIHTDGSDGSEPESDPKPAKTSRRGVRRPDGDKG